MLPSTIVINTPEKLIKSILNFVNGKYCSNMKQLSKTSCSFKKKEIRKMGQNSQNILEFFFFKKVAKRLKHWKKIFPETFENAGFD